MNDCDERLHITDISLANILRRILPSYGSQEHTNNVITADTSYVKPPIADAAITSHIKQILVVMTADCGLFYWQVVANFIRHSRRLAWLSTIIAHTVQKMSAPAHSLIAWIGPCISKTLYWSWYCVKNCTRRNPWTREQRGFCRFKSIARDQLLQAGIETIYIDPSCTYTDNRYYSYRRHKITGRQVSGIMISA